MSDLTTELVRICRHFAAFERGAVCCGTVTVPQCLVMQELLWGGPQEVSALAGFAGASASAMTRLVDGLVKRGWASRERAEEDRRRVVVTLTDEGETEARRLVGMTEAGISVVMSRIPEPDRADVVRVLRLLRTAMDETAGRWGCC